MLNIDQEFKTLLMPLLDEEYKGLEESILSEGCRVALDLWEGILIDGHNRYEICQKHDIEFKTNDIELDSRNDVTVWITKNQLSRRNYTPFQKAELALRAKPAIVEKAKERKIESGKIYGEKHPKEVNPKWDKPLNKEAPTLQKLADLAGVGKNTIHRTETVLKKAPEKVKQAVRTGKITLNKAYKEVKKEEKKIITENKQKSNTKDLDEKLEGILNADDLI